MLKLKVTLAKYWVEALCCYFFGIKILKPCGFHLRRLFRPGRGNSVWKTGWFVSMFMSIGWDSSFGIPILNLRWLNLINLSSEFAYRLLTTLC